MKLLFIQFFISSSFKIRNNRLQMQRCETHAVVINVSEKMACTKKNKRKRSSNAAFAAIPAVRITYVSSLYYQYSRTNVFVFNYTLLFCCRLSQWSVIDTVFKRLGAYCLLYHVVWLQTADRCLCFRWLYYMTHWS